MKLLLVSQEKKRNFALSLLFAFSMVFLCDFLCDAGIIDPIFGRNFHSHKIENSSDHHQLPDHHDGSGDAHHDHGIAGGGHEPGSSDDECCEEETNQLYASLVEHDAPNFDLEKIPVLHSAIYQDQLNDHLTFYKEHNPNSLKSALSPPVRGWFVRILHQSFLC